MTTHETTYGIGEMVYFLHELYSVHNCSRCKEQRRKYRTEIRFGEIVGIRFERNAHGYSNTSYAIRRAFKSGRPMRRQAERGYPDSRVFRSSKEAQKELRGAAEATVLIFFCRVGG